MAKRSLTRWHKAGALMPMALLVTAWGAAVSSGGLATATSGNDVEIPDVPQAAVNEPASVAITPGIDRRGGTVNAVSSLSQNGIPTAALNAYRRTEMLLGKADSSCKLPWSLVAAIGRVESNHGRINGSSLAANGVARPGIIGIPLNGKNNTRRITDTDGGRLDQDTEFDRAVGPMQFIPQTWESVAVDGDADGKKNPQDIDDAAAAAGVYLCAGPGNLSSDRDARTAVRRYNQSSSYVNLVMQIAKRYAAGDFTESANSVTAAPSYTNRAVDQTLTKKQRTRAAKAQKRTAGKPAARGDRTDGGSSGRTGDSGSGPTGGSKPSTGGGSRSTGDPSPVPTPRQRSVTGGRTAGGAVQGVTDGIGVGGVTRPVTGLLTYTEATLQCAPYIWSASRHGSCMAEFGF